MNPARRFACSALFQDDPLTLPQGMLGENPECHWESMGGLVNNRIVINLGKDYQALYGRVTDQLRCPSLDWCVAYLCPPLPLPLSLGLLQTTAAAPAWLSLLLRFPSTTSSSTSSQSGTSSERTAALMTCV